MSGHAEGRIDEHGAGPLEGGGEQLDRAVEHDGGMDLAVGHGIGTCPLILIPLRSDLPPGKCGRADIGWESETRR
ncbi:hypothetical protein GCM10027057_07970 [Marisediminicola antarctica]